MKPYEIALHKFLERYINKPWFEGALLCGSYASGNQNKFSDIDVVIVAANDIGWHEKSNCYVDGFLMEYTINPVYKIEEFMQSGMERHSMIDQNMFAYGVILHDKHGIMKKLRQKSVRDLKKKIKPFSEYSNNFKKYHLWDKYDELQSLKHDGFHTDLIYWTLVGNLVEAYCDFNCLPHLSLAKIEKILTNKDFAKRYHITQLPDERFTELLMACFNANKKEQMVAIEKLYNYVMETGGGFDIGKFVGRKKIEKK